MEREIERETGVREKRERKGMAAESVNFANLVRCTLVISAAH